MESTEDFLSRSMGQFTSAKKVKAVKPTTKVSEQTEQLNFCKWLKHTYPEVLFRSDIQSSANKTPFMQNIKQILDPYSGWPDVMVYFAIPGRCCGLAIELKSMTASLSGDHFKNQLAMHELLRKQGWEIHVCRGAENAKDVFIKFFRSI